MDGLLDGWMHGWVASPTDFRTSLEALFTFGAKHDNTLATKYLVQVSQLVLCTGREKSFIMTRLGHDKQL